MIRTNKLEALPQSHYAVVYADPPWRYYGDPSKDQACGKHYNTLSFIELARMHVEKLLRPKCILLMWATSSHLAEACELFPYWGCRYRGVFQIWVKTSQSGNIIHGQGTRPSTIKPTSELLLWGAPTTRGRPLPLHTESMEQVVLAPRPGNVHSKKPDVFRENIVTLFGDVPRVELFARGAIPDGWDAWGDRLS